MKSHIFKLRKDDLRHERSLQFKATAKRKPESIKFRIERDFGAVPIAAEL